MEYGSVSTDSVRREVRYGCGKESYVFVIPGEREKGKLLNLVCKERNQFTYRSILRRVDRVAIGGQERGKKSFMYVQ